jgi:hypothetical protein
VTVAGSNFGATQGSSTVKFNATTATVTTWSATSIAVTVPSGATTGNVVVHAAGVDSNGQSFTVVPAPSISSLSPTSGAVGASVTVNGSNFGATQGASTVKFNGTTATATSWSPASIAVTVPSGATSGTVVVRASGVNSNGVSFTVAGTPNISSLSPTSGAPGTSVTITGTNFGATQGASTVKFNGTLATPTSWSSTTVRAPVPVGATSGNVVIHAGGVDSNGKSFTVPPAPIISSLSPTSGFPGISVTIAGSNFGATKGSSTVKFNGVTATTTSWSGTSIAATVPATAVTGPVVVTVSSQPSNGMTFTVPTLVSIAVTPQTLSVPVGGKQRYTAVGTYSDSSTFDVSATATWASTDTTIATIASGGLLSTAAQGAATVQATVGSVTGSTGVSVTKSSFVHVGDLRTPRDGHTATLLPNGKVLITGGQYGGTILSSAELYDPVLGIFTPTGSMSAARTDHTATLLDNGLVLIAGGVQFEPVFKSLRSIELFDPSTGTFTFAGSMLSDHFFHTATLLPNGTVLIAAGHYLIPEGGGGTAASELYNPVTNAFALTSNALTTPRSSHTATRLADGTVLIAGGNDDGSNTTAAAELYDASAGTFAAVGSLNAPRLGHTATLLDDGRVLVVGGNNSCPGACDAELYDPVAHVFTSTSRMSLERTAHSATLLSTGLVLVVGGQNSVNRRLRSSSILLRRRSRPVVRSRCRDSVTWRRNSPMGRCWSLAVSTRPTSASANYTRRIHRLRTHSRSRPPSRRW